MTDTAYEIFFDLDETSGLYITAQRADGKQATKVVAFPITRPAIANQKQAAIDAVKALP